VACRKEQFTGMTGMQINVFGVFSKTIEKGDPKEWLLEFILLFQLCAFVGGEGVASLETGLRDKASGAKIDVGQNLVAPRGVKIWWTVGASALKADSQTVSSVKLPPDHLLPIHETLLAFASPIKRLRTTTTAPLDRLPVSPTRPFEVVETNGTKEIRSNKSPGRRNET
jgi:hypothetical protein